MASIISYPFIVPESDACPPENAYEIVLSRVIMFPSILVILADISAKYGSAQNIFLHSCLYLITGKKDENTVSHLFKFDIYGIIGIIALVRYNAQVLWRTFMGNILNLIGINLKNNRKARGISLDRVSEITGVSKAMLGQIERGESNPSVAILWKIATGLNVSFSSFLKDTQKQQDLSFIPFKEINPVIENQGSMKIYPLFFFDRRTGIEIFTIELEPNCDHCSEPHDEGVEEYIIVCEGTLEVVIDEIIYRLDEGDALRFHANKKHTYRNFSDRCARFQNTIYYLL